ncbi:hypothetical protein [Burkholderia cenocepacia]|uniref:hypothetical protein n=1 Tax=Burkholderia cenocepacia TaxID=95486 RepID=UPI00209ADD3E|nr:hypothetical protein [Burkholderia cenocepacia]
MTSAFKGSELTRSDLQGGTVYLDGYGGVVVAQGATVMLLGINPAMLALGLTSPAMSMILADAVANAPALLYMHGRTAGFQAGVGGGDSGWLSPLTYTSGCVPGRGAHRNSSLPLSADNTTS